MNIFERIKFRYYISKKYTFRIHVGEYYKDRKYYKEKILEKKGFVKAKIVDGYYTLWCNPDRITSIEFKDENEIYADNSPTIVESYHGLSHGVCEKCLEKTNCKKYKYYLERSAQNESNDNN